MIDIIARAGECGQEFQDGRKHLEFFLDVRKIPPKNPTMGNRYHCKGGWMWAGVSRWDGRICRQNWTDCQKWVVPEYAAEAED